jgi:hypothetical protein
VRVKHSLGREEHIQFPQKGYDDFELRSGDLAVLSYVGTCLIVVQNLTIGQYCVANTTWADEIFWVLGAIGLFGAFAFVHWLRTGTLIWQQWFK